MAAAAAAFATLSVALAWPVPIALASARWPTRYPAAAVALWQSLAVAGALSIIGCLLAVAAAPAGSLAAAADALLPRLFSGPIPPEFAVVHLVALALAGVFAAHLFVNLAFTATKVERERRRQHQLVALLTEPMPGKPRTHVIAHPIPFAYCIPGLRNATVVTDGLIALLDAREVDAVVAHERAHLDQFHHLVLLAFRAWHGSLPWFPIANRAEQAVAQLTEMLADDTARRAVGTEPLRRALELVGESERNALGESGGVRFDARVLGERMHRLHEPSPSDDPMPRLVIGAAALTLLAMPIAVYAAILL